MRSLNGYLKKIPLLFSLVIALISLSTQNSFAEDNFNLSPEFIHTIQGDTISTQAIITISADTPKVISYFTITIPQENISPTCRNESKGTDVECTSYKRNGVTDILFDLNNAIIKPSSPVSIAISYSVAYAQTNTYNLVSKFQGYNTTKTTLIYPRSLGEPLWASDTIQNIKAIGETYQIQIEKPLYPNLSILFGEHVSYQFEINKTFTNTLETDNQTFEIIVPSDSTHQTIIWTKIEPTPNLAEQDEDGNYILQYIVGPKSSQDCKINGTIIMHNDSTNNDDIATYLTTQSGYWKPTEKNEFLRILEYLKTNVSTVNDTFSDIRNLDDTSKQLVIKYLYSYTIERLNPQTNLTDGIITDSRVGFDQLVENPNEVTPSDYSDFLITILRYYGIPARQIIGFVSNISGYTSDGFYNYWVEAYDSVSGRWITLDPFLEDFSQKSLYNSPFFDHISILKRGKNPVAPKLTFYQDTDFKVTYNTEEAATPELSTTTSLYFESNTIISPYVKAILNITNTGNIAIRNYEISQSNIEMLEKYIDPVNNISSQIILPNQSSTIQFNILNLSLPDSLVAPIKFSNFDYNQEITTTEGFNIQTPVFITILVKTISLAVFAGIVYLGYWGIKKLRKKNG